MNNVAQIKITFSGGRKECEVASVDEAKELIRATWPDAFFYANDDRILAWENEERSENDDGYAAVASIWTR